jgi:hypothetical protein
MAHMDEKEFSENTDDHTHHHNHHLGMKQVMLMEDDSQLFYDCHEEQEGYIDDDEEELYPIITTSTIHPRRRDMSLQNIESLLLVSESAQTLECKDESKNDDNDNDNDNSAGTTNHAKGTVSFQRMDNGTAPPEMASSPPPVVGSPTTTSTTTTTTTKIRRAPSVRRGLSKRLSSLRLVRPSFAHRSLSSSHPRRTSSMGRQESLETPRVMIKERGFPGLLTQDEVQECVSEMGKRTYTVCVCVCVCV